MTIINTINNDINKGMKEGNSELVSILRLIRASVQKIEKDRQNISSSDYNVAITDADVISCIQKELKQRQETLEFAVKASRQDLVDKEKSAINILNTYMPQQLSQEEIVHNVQLVIDQVGNDFRAVMPVAASLLKGRANGKMVNEVVTEMTVKN